MLEQAQNIHESKKESQSYKCSLKRIFDMLEFCDFFDKIATQNNLITNMTNNAITKYIASFIVTLLYLRY